MVGEGADSSASTTALLLVSRSAVRMLSVVMIHKKKVLFVWETSLLASFSADDFDFRRSDFVALVTPLGVNVGEHVSDVFVAEVKFGHDALELVSIDGDFTTQAIENNSDSAIFIRIEEVGLGERREGVRDAEASRLVTGTTDCGKFGFSASDALFFVFSGWACFGVLGHGLDSTTFWAVNEVVDFARVNRLVGSRITSCGFEHSDRTFVKSAEDGVVNDDVGARGIEFKIEESGATCGDECGLHIDVRGAKTCLGINVVKDLTDNVEG